MRLVLVVVALGTVYLPVVGQAPAGGMGAARGCVECSCEQLAALGADIGHAYGPVVPGECAVVPMVWPGSELDPVLAANAQRVGVLLGYNEPDNCLPGGWCLEMGYIVEHWPELEAACPVPCRLVSPSAVDSGWFAAFDAAFRARWGRGPRMDVTAVNVYFDPAQVAGALARVEERAAMGRAVWITEYACLPGVAWSLSECMSAADAFRAGLPGAVEAAFWFRADFAGWECAGWARGFLAGALFDRCGEMTAMGEWYRGAR